MRIVGTTMECETTQPDSKQRAVYTVFWIVLLILVAWPLAWLLAPAWIVLLALEAVFPPGTLVLEGSLSTHYHHVTRSFRLATTM